MKHTPGPWKLGTGWSQGWYRSLVGVDGKNVVTLMPPYPYRDAHSKAQTNADAQLISAAPELFEALSNLEAEISSRFGSDGAKSLERMGNDLRPKIEAARAACAKARGEK